MKIGIKVGKDHDIKFFDFTQVKFGNDYAYLIVFPDNTYLEICDKTDKGYRQVFCNIEDSILYFVDSERHTAVRARDLADSEDELLPEILTLKRGINNERRYVINERNCIVSISAKRDENGDLRLLIIIADNSASIASRLK